MTAREIVKVYQYMMSGDVGNISLGIELCFQSDDEYLRNLPFLVRDKLFGLSNSYQNKELEYEDQIKDHEMYAGAYPEGHTWGKSYDDVDLSELYGIARFYKNKSKDISHKLDAYMDIFGKKVLERVEFTGELKISG